MFYAHFVLAKKGPLARIWLAAHWDKKLTKAHVFETNIEKSVEGILQPKVKMALRTSGHLLLGVVRIYSRKAKYLLADCNEAFVKIKMAFRPGMVDLPEENREAAVNAITLPEVFHDFDTAMPDLNDVDLQAQFNMNQTRAEEITMREDYGQIDLDTGDDGFGDLNGDETPSELRDGTVSNLREAEESLFTDEPQPGTSKDVLGGGGPGGSSKGIDLVESGAPTPRRDDDEGLRDDGFGAVGGSERNPDLMAAGGLFEGGGLFDEPQLDVTDKPPSMAPMSARSMSDDGGDFGGPPSPGGASSIHSPRPGTPPNVARAAASVVGDDAGPVLDETASLAATPARSEANLQVTTSEQTTLLQNEEESFALAPVDASMMKGSSVRTKRKRKLVVDEVKAIAGEEMKAQLSDTQDIVTALDLAPPTKRLMHWKETGGVEKLFALPGRPLHARSVFKLYQSHLTARPAENEVFEDMLGDSQEHENIQLEKVPGEEDLAGSADPRTPGRRGRKRKERAGVDEDEASPEKQQPTRRSARGQAAGQEKENQPQNSSSTETQQQILFNPNVEPDTPAPPTPAPPTPAGLQTPHHDRSQFENLGYDPASVPPTPAGAGAPPTNASTMENMGWDGQQSVSGAGAGDPASMAPLTPGPPPSMGGATPYRDDDFDAYGGPASVGPSHSVHGGDMDETEKGEEETQEEFEERVLSKRAAHLNKILSSRLQDADSVVRLTEMTRRNNRKQVAQKFYSLLVLQKVMAVNLTQSECYGDLSVVRGPKFENAVL